MKSDIDLSDVKSDLAEQNCKWEFNPPHSSHYGGAWERKIGSVRRVLEGALTHTANSLLSRDELDTLLQEAAAIVNSTPLWEVSSNPNDPKPLSPASLLTLKDSPHPASPEEFTERDLLPYGSRRWRRVQAIADEFWKRWQQTCRQSLQSRRKWNNVEHSIQPGDLVLLHDKATKRDEWPLAKVVDVKESSDGLVRSATVEVAKANKELHIKTHQYIRPVSVQN